MDTHFIEGMMGSNRVYSHREYTDIVDNFKKGLILSYRKTPSSKVNLLNLNGYLNLNERNYGNQTTSN